MPAPRSRYDGTGGGVGPLADDDCICLVLSRQPASYVHHVAHHGQLAPIGWPRGSEEGLAGVDPDAQLQAGELLRMVGEGALEVEGSPHGPLRVVLVSNGSTEHSHELAADDVVDCAAVAGNHHGQPGHAPVEQGA